jgi:hypothetical protein
VDENTAVFGESKKIIFLRKLKLKNGQKSHFSSAKSFLKAKTFIELYLHCTTLDPADKNKTFYCRMFHCSQMTSAHYTTAITIFNHGSATVVTVKLTCFVVIPTITHPITNTVHPAIYTLTSHCKLVRKVFLTTSRRDLCPVHLLGKTAAINSSARCLHVSQTKQRATVSVGSVLK